MEMKIPYTSSLVDSTQNKKLEEGQQKLSRLKCKNKKRANEKKGQNTQEM